MDLFCPDGTKLSQILGRVRTEVEGVPRKATARFEECVTVATEAMSHVSVRRTAPTPRRRIADAAPTVVVDALHIDMVVVIGCEGDARAVPALSRR